LGLRARNTGRIKHKGPTSERHLAPRNSLVCPNVPSSIFCVNLQSLLSPLDRLSLLLVSPPREVASHICPLFSCFPCSSGVLSPMSIYVSSCSVRLLLHLCFGLDGCFDTRLLSIGDGCFSVLQELLFMSIYLPYYIPCIIAVQSCHLIVDFCTHSSYLMPMPRDQNAHLNGSTCDTRENEC
jgi:hypothetical protein